MYFSIKSKDFSHLVSGLKVGYETLVSDKSGRNAAGFTVVDVVARKKKLYVTLRHTTDEEMKEFLTYISSYVMNISFLNPQTQEISHINCYCGTPEPEYYTIQNGKIIFKPMSINFIEL